MDEDGSLTEFLSADPGNLLEPERLVTLLVLAFFLGMAFEEYFGSRALKPPGGVRTFPLLALAGALLYALAPGSGNLFLGGLVTLGAWLSIWYWHRLSLRRDEPDVEGETDQRLSGGIVALVGNLLAYLLGPVTLTQPLWIPVAIAVAVVLLTGARDRLHEMAEKIGGTELATAAKFLIITGVVLPLVPNEPVADITTITPFQVWLAVVVVSALSYASYLVQRYAAPRHGLLYSAVLGGLYSSTATTVVLSRRASTLKGDASQHMLNAALVLSTAVMFPRLLIFVAIFNPSLALSLAPALLILFGLGLLLTFWLLARRGKNEAGNESIPPPSNPLEIQTALIFALLYIGFSIAVGWARPEFGDQSLFVLAALSGITDITPLVLNIAQTVGGGAPTIETAAILIAATSNNVLKGGYILAFAGKKRGIISATALFVLSLAGIAAILVTLGLA